MSNQWMTYIRYVTGVASKAEYPAMTECRLDFRQWPKFTYVRYACFRRQDHRGASRLQGRKEESSYSQTYYLISLPGYAGTTQRYESRSLTDQGYFQRPVTGVGLAGRKLLPAHSPFVAITRISRPLSRLRSTDTLYKVIDNPL